MSETSELRILDLTPDPRILEMLGEINLKGWQCVAELIDNSIDSMIVRKALTENNLIEVTIPTPKEISEDSPLIVRDNAGGMSGEQLEKALRAGYSSQQTHQSLGLFGMGFNIASARLGHTATVWTSTADSDHDIGVRINLKEMKQSRSFKREILTRRTSKTAPTNSSGTSIEISGYHPRAKKMLKRNDIFRLLQHAYSSEMLQKYDITIKVNRKTLSFPTFCTWDESRSVTYQGEYIPAKIHFREVLTSKLFCSSCLLDIEGEVTAIKTVCPHCGSGENVSEKNYSVRGWVGIQRYFDSDDFGINIIRNGRIIKNKSKDLFTWKDPNGDWDDLLEYPIDNVALGGRIVGEIFADFILPVYTKDGFTETEMWQKALEVVRGPQPMQPQIAAKKMQMGKNKSPLAKLFYGYRKTEPGLKYLVPGTSDGHSINVLAKEWAQKYQDGEPDYQTDEKWYGAAEIAEAKNDPDEGTGLPGGGSKPGPRPPGGGTEEEEEKKKYLGLKEFVVEREFDLQPVLQHAAINTKIYNFKPPNPADFHPIVFQTVGANKYIVLLNQLHSMLADYPEGWEDLLAMEVASRFQEVQDDRESWPISRIYFLLKTKYFSESILNVDTLTSSARRLMIELQQFLIREDFELENKPVLYESTLKSLKDNYFRETGVLLKKTSKITHTAGYIKYLGISYMFEFIDEYPQLIFDHKFFSLAYSDLEDELKKEYHKTYMGYFNDVRWIINELSQLGPSHLKHIKRQMIRSKLSLSYLTEVRV
jgi:hypothetical protein